jgi:hypothetical protein
MHCEFAIKFSHRDTTEQTVSKEYIPGTIIAFQSNKKC